VFPCIVTTCTRLLIPIKTLLALLQAKFAACVKGVYTFSITPPSLWYQSLSVSRCCVCIEAQVPVNGGMQQEFDKTPGARCMDGKCQRTTAQNILPGGQHIQKQPTCTMIQSGIVNALLITSSGDGHYINRQGKSLTALRLPAGLSPLNYMHAGLLSVLQ